MCSEEVSTHTTNAHLTDEDIPSSDTCWIQVHATTENTVVPSVQDAFEAAGALAITLSETNDTDALWEPEPGTNPLWQTTCVTGLFHANSMRHADTRDQLTRQLTSLPLINLRWEVLEDRAWEREWMKHFKPMLIANRLLIQPTLDDTDTITDTINAPATPASQTNSPSTHPAPTILRLDPGLAFGTGSHPTTQLCLTWLCQQDLSGASVIDYGCGSGILAIAALLLGADTVIAVDIDKQALGATLDNAKKNHVQDRLHIGGPELLRNTQQQYDVLIANILAQPLLSLRQHFAHLLKPQGIWAISGLLHEQADAIEHAYREHLQPTARTQHEDWILIAGKQIHSNHS